MTIVAYMDDDNNLIIDKTRCFPYAGKVQHKPKGEWFRPFIGWLAGQYSGPGYTDPGNTSTLHGRKPAAVFYRGEQQY
jgi:hypothetical protein